METISISPGTRVLVRTAFGNQLPRVAVTAPTKGHDFLVVWVCPEEEWTQAVDQDRDPDARPWPAEDVELDVSNA